MHEVSLLYHKGGLGRRHVEQIRKCWSRSKQLQEKRGAELNFQNEGKETSELLKGKPRQQRDRDGQQHNERPQLPPQNETQEERHYPARIQRPPDRYFKIKCEGAREV